jgi:parvulin-like peptidyl-prolyl isomerase
MSQRVATVRAIAGATLVLGSLFILAATTGVAVAQGEEIIVNGEPITAADIERRLKFDQLSTHREPSRREVIEELTEEELKLQAAQRSGTDVADSDVDAAYAAMAKRMNLTPEQLTGALAHAGVDAVTLKQRIRADIAWRQYTRGSGSPMHLRDGTSLRERRDTAPFSKGLNDGGPSPRKKKDDGPSWRE